jgi:hypothetical protein
MNEKSWVTHERLYSEARKNRRSLGITEEVEEQQKSTEKPRQPRKAASISKSIPDS